jgi:hypothetical protein
MFKIQQIMKHKNNTNPLENKTHTQNELQTQFQNNSIRHTIAEHPSYTNPNTKNKKT